MLLAGNIEYLPERGTRKVKLTLIGSLDAEILEKEGISALRRKRIIRLAEEARAQGSPLSYMDLCELLLSSLATLKRDIALLKKSGIEIPLRKKKNRKAFSCGTIFLFLFSFLLIFFFKDNALAEEGLPFKYPFYSGGGHYSLQVKDGFDFHVPLHEDELTEASVPESAYGFSDYETDPYGQTFYGRRRDPALEWEDKEYPYTSSVTGRAAFYSGRDYSYFGTGVSVGYNYPDYSKTYLPSISLDYDRGKLSMKNGDSYTSNSLDLKMELDRALPDGNRTGFFFNYRYYGLGLSGKDYEMNELELYYYYAWRRAMVWGNLYYRSDGKGENSGLGQAGFYFSDTYKNYFSYFVQVLASLDKNGDKASLNLSGQGGVRKEKTIRITPEETAYFYVEGDVQQYNGRLLPGQDKSTFSVTSLGQITSNRINNLTMRAFAGVGYNEQGYPVQAGFGVQTRGLKRLSAGGQYTFQTLIPKKGPVTWFDHIWNFNVGYKIRPNLEIKGFLTYYVREWDNGQEFKKLTRELALFWKPTPQNYLELRAMLEDYPNGETLRLRGIFKQQLTKQSWLTLDGMYLHNSWNDYSEEQLGAGFTFTSKDKKTSIGVNYRVRLSGTENSRNDEHRIMGTITTRF